MTLPHTKVGGNRVRLSLGPLKYVLWLGCSVNGVEPSFLDAAQGGRHAPASLWELSREDSGTGARDVALAHVSCCWRSRDGLGKKGPGPGVRILGLSKAKTLAQGKLALFVHSFNPLTFVEHLL